MTAPNDRRLLTPEEERHGWYAPGTPAGSTANVDERGRHLRFFEADSRYRRGCGVAPRYDAAGRLIAPAQSLQPEQEDA